MVQLPPNPFHIMYIQHSIRLTLEWVRSVMLFNKISFLGSIVRISVQLVLNWLVYGMVRHIKNLMMGCNQDGLCVYLGPPQTRLLHVLITMDLSSSYCVTCLSWNSGLHRQHEHAYVTISNEIAKRLDMVVITREWLNLVVSYLRLI